MSAQSDPPLAAKEASKEKEVAKDKALEPSSQSAAKVDPLHLLVARALLSSLYFFCSLLLLLLCFSFETCTSSALPRHNLMKSFSFLQVPVTYA